MSERKFYISAMDCPTEEQIIRNGLKNHPGVAKLDFDLINRVLTVGLTPTGDATKVKSALDGLGMQAQPVEDNATAGPSAKTEADTMRARWWTMGIAGVLAAGAEVLAWTINNDKNPWVIGLVVLALAIGGRDTLRKSWVALRTLTLNINFLMTLAILGAIAVGQWPEAGMVAVLFGIAELIEAYSLDRARNAIHALMETVPETARVWHSHGHDEPGHWHEIPVTGVDKGERVQVRPGERIPLDGVVLEGNSGVDQAAVTGESLPVEKEPGDTVYAGSINGRGTLVFQVTAHKGDTTLDRVMQAVQKAQAERAPTQRFVDRFAQVYTPSVVAVAVLVALVPPLLHLGSWSHWLYTALVMLVIACPCALVLSTPVTVVSGLAAAAKQGILVKGGAYMESGRHLRVLALDKTGTITKGKPMVTDVIPLGNGNAESLLHLAASLNATSEHPLAEAIVHACAEKHECQLPPVAEFEALVGRGVTGTLGDKRYYIGNHRLTEENKVCGPHVESVLERLEAEGKTAVVLTNATEALAVLGVADTLREESRDALRELHELGIRTVLLSGDNQRVTAAMAAQLGIDDARGELLPEDKLTAIAALQQQYGAVGMIGDGINDAPALAKAEIGFSVGQSGTDTALETADVVLLHGDLRKLPRFVRLSRQVAGVLTQNIVFALAIKAAFFALALMGKANLWMAVLADVGTSLLVVANGLRLLGAKTR